MPNKQLTLFEASNLKTGDKLVGVNKGSCVIVGGIYEFLSLTEDEEPFLNTIPYTGALYWRFAKVVKRKNIG